VRSADNASVRRRSPSGSSPEYPGRRVIYGLLMCLRECGPLSYIRLADLAIARKFYTPKRTPTYNRKKAWASWASKLLLHFGLVNRRVDGTVRSSGSKARLEYFLTEFGQEWIRMYEEEASKGNL